MALRIFGQGTVANGFLYPSSGNSGFTGTNFLQLWLDRMRIENFEPDKQFMQVVQEANVPAGYGEMAYFRNVQQGRVGNSGTSNWSNVASSGFSAANTSTTEPTASGVQKGTVKFSPQLYLTRYTFGRYLDRLSPVEHTMGVMEEMMNSYYREVDLLLQEAFYSDATTTNTSNLIYPSGITALTGFTTTNRATTALSLKDIRRAAQLMENDSVPVFPAIGSYLMIITPTQKYDLLGDSTASNSFIELGKHTNMLTARLVRGVIGEVFGVTIVSSSNMKTYDNGNATPANVVPVHPAFVFGAGVAVRWPAQFEVNIVNTPDRTSVNNLDVHIGGAFLYNFRLLQPKAYRIFLTGTTV